MILYALYYEARMIETGTNGKAKILLERLALVPDSKIVVEIGSIRIPIDTASDGYSTIYLARAIEETEAVFFTVDINQSHLIMAAGILLDWDIGTVLVHGDGADFLRQFPLPIDFLHLDGSEPETTFEQFKYAEPKLSPGAVVCIDDCHSYGDWEWGKGNKVIPYLQEKGGWSVIIRPSAFQYKTAVCRKTS